MSHWGRQLKDFVKKKCKVILTISKSQITLAKRRVKAFEIANWFIENEINKN